MRLALAAAVMFVAGVASAEAFDLDPPPTIRTVIDIGVAGGYIARHCPKLQLDMKKYNNLIASYKVDYDDMMSRYGEYFKRENEHAVFRRDMDREQQCAYWGERYGAHGVIPDMILPR